LEFVRDAGIEMELYGLVQVHHEGIRRHNEESLENARKLLNSMYKAYLTECEVYPLIVSSPSCAKSSIGDLICTAAQKLQADLAVVGCRGIGAFKRFFMGSVSKYVAENCQSPVLIVKD